jgi:Cu2+-exporting ATPase
VRQNLCWSVAYNLAALPLAALGLVTPWQAAIGMSLSSIIVVANSLRLSRGAAPRRPRIAQPANAAAEA